MSDRINSDLGVELKSNFLIGSKIGLCVGGGIAAIEAPKVARELRRHGADVRCYVTKNALNFIGIQALEWATNKTIVTEFTGLADHISTEDAYLVFPATADLMAKMAIGLADDVVSTLIQSAFGLKKKIVICPTMHNSLADSPAFKKNKEYLQKWPLVSFIAPRSEEGKQKSPSVENIALEFCHLINKKSDNKSENGVTVALTYGGTKVAIDVARCISNYSTGALGRALIFELYGHGFNITAIEGHCSQPTEKMAHVNVIKAAHFSEMQTALLALEPEKICAIFQLAAISDYLPVSTHNGKISGNLNALSIELKSSPKLLQMGNVQNIPYRMACKLTSESEVDGIATANNFLNANNLQCVLWNNSEVFHSLPEHHTAVLIEKSGKKCTSLKSKKQIAEAIFKSFSEYYLEDK